MGENTLQKMNIPILKNQILQIRWLRVALGKHPGAHNRDAHIQRHSTGCWDLESPRIHLLTENRIHLLTTAFTSVGTD